MINIVGLGYIGLPTALMMATHNNEVIGTDCNKDLIEFLNAGNISFKEDGLKKLYNEAIKVGIKFTTEYQKADVYIISVPTPYNKLSNKVDTSYIVSAVNSILDVTLKGAILIIESTISPGTIDKCIKPLINKRGFVIGKDINIAHAPERIIPGNMIYELINNNRTIGVDDIGVGEKVKQLYKSFCKGEIIITNIKTAEMTKVVENTYRAVNIAFANELSRICRYDDIDVYEVINICNKHPRVNILQPGPGVGGHCVSVDPRFLVGDYHDLANIINESIKINDSQPDFILTRIKEIMKQNNISNHSRVGLYGLTYKENVDDTRESPTLQLLERKGTEQFIVYDPYITKDIVNNQYHDLDAFLNDIDLVVIMAVHDEIRYSQDKLLNKLVFDTRNILDLKDKYHV